MAGDVGGRSCTDSELLLLHPELLSQEFLLLTLEQKNIAVENDIRINKDNLTDLYVQHAIPLPQRDLPKNRWGKMMEKKREQHELKNETKRSSAVDVLSKKRPLIVFDGSSTSTSIKVKKTDSGDNDRLKAPPQASFTSNAFRKLSNSSSSVSPLPLSSNLPMNNKMEHNNNDTKQNHDFPLGPVKLPPLSPVGTTPVKLKRAAPKEEAEAMSFQTASTKSTIVWMAQATNISFLYSWSLGNPKSKHWQIQCMNNLKPPEAKRKIQHVTWP